LWEGGIGTLDPLEKYASGVGRTNGGGKGGSGRKPACSEALVDRGCTEVSKRTETSEIEDWGEGQSREDRKGLIKGGGGDRAAYNVFRGKMGRFQISSS